MTKTPSNSVATPVGLSGGKVIRVEASRTNVLVIVEAWEGSTLEVLFDEAIGFRGGMSSELSDLVVTECSGTFADWCRGRAYDDGSAGGESLYQFLDIDGEIAIEVVAKDVLVRVRS